MTPDSDEQMQEGRVPVILAVDDDHEVASALERQPDLLETSMPGVFAAGDVRYRSMKRVASAVGEGSTAISLVHQYLGAGSQSDTASRSTPAHVCERHRLISARRNSHD